LQHVDRRVERANPMKALPDRAQLMTYAVLLATRGAYILSRLLVALALPLILSVEALGKFGLFSSLAAALPVVIALGLPEHATRRLNRGLNRPVFRAFAVQTVLGFAGAFAVTALWLAVYPDIDRRMIAIVAGIVALTYLRGNLAMVLLGRGAVIRSNITFAVATSGPFFAILAALVLPRGAVDLTTVCLAWLLTCIIGAAVALPGSWHDLRDLIGGRAVRTRLLLSRQARIIVGLRHIYVNQIADLTRTYLDRLVLPLVAGFHIAGIYNVFALATSVAVMVPNALCGQVDLPRLVQTARDDKAVYRRIVTAGIIRAAVVAALMIAPLFLMKPAVDTILGLALDPGLFYALCAGAMLSAMLAAVADYLWYAIYAARAERGLSRYIIPTILLSVVLIVGGSGAFGLVGASLAVVAANACVVLFRVRALAAYLARQMPAEEPASQVAARLVPARAT
jgi:O-antigen/teichoic acid export membrane protein